MRTRLIVPLIGYNIIMATIIAATLFLSAQESSNEDEEIRDALLQIACQEYYSSSSEQQRLFLSLIIQELVKQENIANISDEEINRGVQLVYWSLLEKVEEYLPPSWPHEDD